MIDWKKKLSSRKLWVAIAGFVSGCILTFGGSAEIAEKIDWSNFARFGGSWIYSR